MTTVVAPAPAPVGTTTRQRVGLVLGVLFSLSSVPSALTPTGDGEVGPPLPVLVLGSLLGVVGLVACVLAWRGHERPLRTAAVAIVLITVTGLPAMFVDVPLVVKALVSFSVLLTVVVVVLMFSRGRRPGPV